MQSYPPAIVLGCHKAGLGIIRALGEVGVPVIGVYYNPWDMGYVSRYLIGSYRFPHPGTKEEAFTERLVSLAGDWGGGVLIPSDDATLVHVSRNKTELLKYFKVVSPEWDTTKNFIDKRYTYRLAEKVGVAAPRTVNPKGLYEIREFADRVGFPCIVKPSIGHCFYEIFKKKMIFARNIEEVEDAYKVAADAGSEMMIQEYIPGDDRSGANYNSFFYDDKPVLEMTAQKVRLSPPGTGFPRVVVSRNIPDIVEPGRKIINALGFNGFSCTEFKKDARDGKYKLMEVNGRLNLSSYLSYKAGINFAFVAYKHAIDNKRPAPVPRSAVEELYWIDLEKDIIETIKHIGKENLTINEYLRPYLRKKVFTVLSLSDPMPFIKRNLDIFRSLPKFLIKGKVQTIPSQEMT